MNLNLNASVAVCLMFQRKAEKEILHYTGGTYCQAGRWSSRYMEKNFRKKKENNFSAECWSVYIYASAFCAFNIVGKVDENFQRHHCLGRVWLWRSYCCKERNRPCFPLHDDTYIFTMFNIGVYFQVRPR